jgi:transposase-like protein
MHKEVSQPALSKRPRRHSQEFKLDVVKRIEAGESLSALLRGRLDILRRSEP